MSLSVFRVVPERFRLIRERASQRRSIGAFPEPDGAYEKSAPSRERSIGHNPIFIQKRLLSYP